MNTKNIAIGLLVVLTLVFGVLYYLAQSKVSALEEQLGGSGSGQNFFQKPNFIQGLAIGVNSLFEINKDGIVTNGGAPYVIATGTTSFTASQLCANRNITNSSGNIPGTITLLMPAATSTIPCLESVGDSIEFIVRSAAATSTLTFSATSGGLISTSTIVIGTVERPTTTAWILATSTYTVVKALRITSSLIMYMMHTFR